MPKLDNKLFEKIQTFNQKGESFIENGQLNEAIKEYQKAWNTLPEPKQIWDAALWIKVAQAEIYLELDDFTKGKQKLLDAILCSGAVSNPLVHLLLGICCFEMGDKQCSREELQIAYDLEGESIFQDGDEKYQQFLKSSQDKDK